MILYEPTSMSFQIVLNFRNNKDTKPGGKYMYLVYVSVVSINRIVELSLFFFITIAKFISELKCILLRMQRQNYWYFNTYNLKSIHTVNSNKIAINQEAYRYSLRTATDCYCTTSQPEIIILKLLFLINTTITLILKLPRM